MVANKELGILFAPGSFCPAACFDQAKEKLKVQGFNPVLVATNSSLVNGAKGLFDDVKETHRVVQPHVDEGREFVVLGHSCTFCTYPKTDTKIA